MRRKMKNTRERLRELQALPVDKKVLITKARIKEWVEEFGEDGVYVSFSGGKDSTVLLHLVREDFPEVPAVFVDTGLEYPEIRGFVKTFGNMIWLKPKMNFRKVVETYGYPIISKQVAKRVYEWHNAERKGKDVTRTEAYKEFTGTRYFLRSQYGEPAKSWHNKEKWMFLVNAPFRISHKCCDIMKKDSFKLMKGRNPITAQMASESINRENAWLLHGCNAYDAACKISNPMAFWTEQDVLQYIKENGIKIAPVYGDIVYEDDDGFEYDDGLSGMRLKTTGYKRTGCMFCGFGCHLEKESRFVRMKRTHPKQYEWIMKPWDEGGLGYKDVIDWINEHGNMDIKY